MHHELPSSDLFQAYRLSVRWVLVSHFTDGETEVQRG